MPTTTTMIKRISKQNISGAIPGISKLAWEAVATLTNPDGSYLTNLTPILMDDSGSDQMAMQHTITFFSESVIQLISKSSQLIA